MVKVWRPMHLISRCCAVTSTVSEKEVCLRELLCFSWRLVEACGGLWPEQRRHEAFLQDQAICPRCDNAEIETEEHRFSCCKGNNTGDPDLVDRVAKTEWIASEARVGLTKPELRSFFLRGLTPGSWLVEEPYEGPEVFLVVDATHDGLHFGPGTDFTDGSKLYPYPRRREVGWGFCSVAADLQLRTRAYGPVTLDNAAVPVAENLLQSSFWSKGLVDPSISTPTASMCALARTRSHSARSAVLTSHFGPDCSKLCRSTRVLLRFLGAEPTSLRTISIISF